eukprot:210043-Ditylum_brightwellii.AAC.1
MSSKTQTPHKRPAGDHVSIEDLCVSNLKLTKKLKKYKKQRGKRKGSYESESSDSDSNSSWLLVNHGGEVLEINNSNKKWK